LGLFNGHVSYLGLFNRRISYLGFPNTGVGGPQRNFFSFLVFSDKLWALAWMMALSSLLWQWQTTAAVEDGARW
jgi:hypothetical protein